MTTKNRKRSLSAFVALIGVLLMSSGFALIATASSASATSESSISFCHWVPGEGEHKNGYNSLTTSTAAFFNAGHVDHENDIFPAGSHNGQSWGAQGDQSMLPDCKDDDEPEVCPEGTDRAGEVKGDEPCDNPPEVCPEGTDRAGEPVDGLPCDEEVEPPAVCGPGTDFPDRLADGSEGPCNEEVSPPGEEPPAAAPPVNNPPAKAPTPTKRATTATVAGPTTSTPSSTVAGPTIPSTVKAGLGEDVAELAATRTSQGLALVGAGALVMLAGGLGMVRRRGVVARI